MSEYSDHPDVCKDDVENNFDDNIDFSSLNELEYELNNMNGRASVAPPKIDEAAERAALEAELDALTAFVAGLDDE